MLRISVDHKINHIDPALPITVRVPSKRDAQAAYTTLTKWAQEASSAPDDVATALTVLMRFVETR